jgi:Tfp pilus assembly protein FimT
MSIQTGQDKASLQNHEQSGFRLIELVMIVVIMSILASFAVPRVAAVRAATPAAETTALGSELRVAVARVHAIWLAERQPAQLVIDDSRVNLAFGYPDRGTVDALLEEAQGFEYDAASGVFSRLDRRRTVLADCGVSYRPPRVRGEAPRISVVTDGC